MIDNMPFEGAFNPQGFKILTRKNARNIVIAFEGEWRGRKTFNIMNVWLNNDCWAPGKGITVPLEQKAELITALKAL
jgi:Transcriptional Coactivator p15 (PC4)